MTTPARFPYLSRYPSLGNWGLMPLLPFRVEYLGTKRDVVGLVDSGATVNVIHCDLGIQLGADWNQQRPLPPLGGYLASAPTSAIFVDVNFGPFPPTRLMFAWPRNPSVPIVLGQLDFFEEFNVCFFRSRGYFEVMPKSPAP